jgi:hypothetical protein
MGIYISKFKCGIAHSSKHATFITGVYVSIMIVRDLTDGCPAGRTKFHIILRFSTQSFREENTSVSFGEWDIIFIKL